MAPPAFSRETTGSRRELFPEIAPYGSGYLTVGGGHSIYWEQAGNPRGQAALFLHGGPGAGAGSVHRRFFDPRHWRVVLFDQRGAGRSRPLGKLEENTTPHLIEDIEALRRHLGIESWLLFGGSWGSTLAMAYAQAHPERVAACVLRGIFLGRDSEVDWFLHGIRSVFPDAHAQFLGFLPEDERSDILDAYRRRLNDPDPRVHGPAARAWSVYEGSCSTLLPHPEMVSTFSRDRAGRRRPRIEYQ
jgi:proline iminopeptidase